jgi:hypothetical protein
VIGLAEGQIAPLEKGAGLDVLDLRQEGGIEPLGNGNGGTFFALAREDLEDLIF